MKIGQEGYNTEKSCPYLGSLLDSQVSYYFSNRQNYCQHIKKPEPVNLNHQEEFCLSSRYTDCSVIRQHIINHLPIEILGEEPKTKPLPPKKRNQWFLIPVFLVFVLLIVVFYMYAHGAFELETSSVPYQNQQSSLLFNEPAASMTPNNINLFFVIPTKKETTKPSATPVPSIKTTATLGPIFATPFGISQKYLIHQVASGESINYLAIIYNTSEVSIIQINDLMVGNPIQEHQLLVIRPGASSEEAFEKLEAIYIEQRTSLQVIADLYSTTLEKLVDLNDLGSSDSIPAARWIIVPQIPD